MAMPKNLSSARVTAAFAERQLKKDQVLRCFSPDVRLSVIRCTASAQDALRRFNVRNTSAAMLFSRAIAASGLMGSMLKGQERVSLDFRVSTPDAQFSRLFTECVHLGEVRGYMDPGTNDPSLANEKDHTIPSLLANIEKGEQGNLVVSKVLYNHARPVTSIIELQNGDVTSDLRHYFHQSEQIQSVLHLEANITPNSEGSASVQYAGGILAQLLPDGNREVLSNIQDRLYHDSESPLEVWHQNEQQTWDIARNLVDALQETDITDKNVYTKIPFDFFCRCSKAGFLVKLAQLGQAEIIQLREEQPQAHLTCQFCNTTYTMGSVDFDTAISVANGEISPEELQKADAAARLAGIAENAQRKSSSKIVGVGGSFMQNDTPGARRFFSSLADRGYVAGIRR